MSDIGGENGEVAAVADGGPGSWRCSTGEYAATPAVVTDAVVCTTGEAGSAVALGADTGGAVWRRLLDDRILAAPAVAGRAVLVVDGSGASERSARRQATAGGGRSSTAACSTRSPSAHTTTAPRRLRSAVAGGGGERTSTAPTVADGTALVGAGRDGIALAGDGGTERWRVETRERSYTDVVLGGVAGSPGAVEGTVLPTRADDVYALDGG